MAELPTISDKQIADRTSERSFERGQRYFADGLVDAVVWRKGLLTAEVVGSGAEPYVVQMRVDEQGGVRATECSCPAGYGGDCKHIVATLLHYQAHHETIEQRAAVEDLIVELDEGQLRLLVLHLVSRRPGMMDSAERFLAAIR